MHFAVDQDSGCMGKTKKVNGGLQIFIFSLFGHHLVTNLFIDYAQFVVTCVDFYVNLSET